MAAKILLAPKQPQAIIDIARSRLEFYQDSKFNCDENRRAINALEVALEALASRTARRETAGTEGTHNV